MSHRNYAEVLEIITVASKHSRENLDEFSVHILHKMIFISYKKKSLYSVSSFEVTKSLYWGFNPYGTFPEFFNNNVFSYNHDQSVLTIVLCKINCMYF